MKSLLVVALILSGAALVLQQDASAQVSSNRAYSLTGDGFSVSDRMISDTVIELIFTTGERRPSLDLTLSSSILAVDGDPITISGFTGHALRDGQIIIISTKATGPNEKQFDFRAVGRIAAYTDTGAVYTITGIITDSTKTTRLIYTAVLSEFTSVPAKAEQKSDITIKILKNSANPAERTYVEQKAGFAFRYLSEDRLTIPPGTTITFVNEDTQTHSMESGIAQSSSRKTIFIPDGKISSGDIPPGGSWSVTFDQEGFFRLFDKKYLWIDATIFVIDSSKITSTKKALN